MSRRKYGRLFGGLAVLGVLLGAAAPAAAVVAPEDSAITVIPRYEGPLYLWEEAGKYSTWWGFQQTVDVNAVNGDNPPLTVMEGLWEGWPTDRDASLDAHESIRLSLPAPGSRGEIRDMNGDCLSTHYSMPAYVQSCDSKYRPAEWSVGSDGRLRAQTGSERRDVDVVMSEYVMHDIFGMERWYWTGVESYYVLTADPLRTGLLGSFVHLPSMELMPADPTFTATAAPAPRDAGNTAHIVGTGTPGTVVTATRDGNTLKPVTIGEDGSWQIPVSVADGTLATLTITQTGAGFSDSVTTITVGGTLTTPIIDTGVLTAVTTATLLGALILRRHRTHAPH